MDSIVFEKSYEVRSYDTGTNGKLRPAGSGLNGNLDLTGKFSKFTAKDMAGRNINIIFTLIVTILIVGACSSVKTESYDPNDMSYLYNPLRNKLHPSYRIFHENESTSTLSLQLNSSDLFFSEANTEGVPRAEMSLFIRIFNLTQGRVVTDTVLVNLPVKKSVGRRDYIFNFPLEAEAGFNYEADILLKDQIRNITVQTLIPFDKSTAYNMHNFKIRGHFNKYDIFTHILKEGNYFNLLYPGGEIDSIYLNYFKPFDNVPDPPSMLTPELALDLEPDRKVLIRISDTTPIMLPNRGVYLFTPDSLLLSGYPLFNFGHSYPGLNDPETMIYPLIYLSSQDKIDEMLDADNLKIALDNFWLDITNNVERSRELLRVYYNRVLYANYFFGSYKEGWQTDRGMIYTIYGPPDKVYRTPDGEKWGYKKQVIKSGWGIRYKVEDEYLYFTFMKRANPFSVNDYSLVRNESVTTYWEQAIRSWLSGIVFRLDNPTDI